jgi:hypothetical protein
VRAFRPDTIGNPVRVAQRLTGASMCSGRILPTSETPMHGPRARSPVVLKATATIVGARRIRRLGQARSAQHSLRSSASTRARFHRRIVNGGLPHVVRVFHVHHYRDLPFVWRTSPHLGSDGQTPPCAARLTPRHLTLLDHWAARSWSQPASPIARIAQLSATPLPRWLIDRLNARLRS